MGEAAGAQHSIEAEFKAFVAEHAFPCLGAKAAMNSGSYVIVALGEMATAATSRALATGLEEFVHSKLRHESDYATFVAIFAAPEKPGELEFEQLLWSQLHQLHEIDSARYSWDPAVSNDPDDPRFSFSFGGQALYVVGMHPGSSRFSRRFRYPTLVFNPHEQFERLREEGKWRRLQGAIRARDIELQGEVNPMLSDFGEKPESRQYSGRMVEENWRAPFRAKETAPPARCPFHRR